MEQFLDIRTTAFFTSAAGVAMAVCMVHVWLTRKTYAGFRLWTAGYVCLGLGMLLLSLRGMLPDWLSIILANLLIVLHGSLLCVGLIRFLGSSGRAWLNFLPAAAVLVGFYYYTYVESDVTARIVMVSIAVSLLLLHGAWLASRRSLAGPDGVNRLLYLGFFASGAWFLLRAAITFAVGVASQNFMVSGWFQGLAVLMACLADMVIMVGLVSINAQRLEQELTSARDEIHTLRDFLPICARCKKIRDDEGYWNQLETYIGRHTGTRFTHGICPDCAKVLYPGLSLD